MLDLSNCYIARVKIFLGLRSIDPPVPIDKFLEKNFKKLKSLIKKKLIIVIDEQGNEIDSMIWEDYIVDYYRNNGKPVDSDQDDELINEFIEEPETTQEQQENQRSISDSEKHNPEQEIQDELELIVKIDTEENAKIAHKNLLLKSLEECDPLNKMVLENGLDRTNQKIEELQEERKAILAQINQKIVNHENNG